MYLCCRWLVQEISMWIFQDWGFADASISFCWCSMCLNTTIARIHGSPWVALRSRWSICRTTYRHESPPETQLKFWVNGQVTLGGQTHHEMRMFYKWHRKSKEYSMSVVRSVWLLVGSRYRRLIPKLLWKPIYYQKDIFLSQGRHTFWRYFFNFFFYFLFLWSWN